MTHTRETGNVQSDWTLLRGNTMTTYSNTMSVESIIAADFATATPANIATMFAAASTRETSAAYGKALVVHRAINVKGLKSKDLEPLLGVGKSQISNYVKQVDMVIEMGLTGAAITATWTPLTGSRGWFPKRGTSDYSDLRDAVQATDDQDTKVALINGTPLPENAPKVLTFADAVRMLEGARDLLATLDVSKSDAAIIATLTGEVDAAAAAAPVKVLVAA